MPHVTNHAFCEGQDPGQGRFLLPPADFSAVWEILLFTAESFVHLEIILLRTRQWDKVFQIGQICRPLPSVQWHGCRTAAQNSSRYIRMRRKKANYNNISSEGRQRKSLWPPSFEKKKRAIFYLPETYAADQDAPESRFDQHWLIIEAFTSSNVWFFPQQPSLSHATTLSPSSPSE